MREQVSNSGQLASSGNLCLPGKRSLVDRGAFAWRQGDKGELDKPGHVAERARWSEPSSSWRAREQANERQSRIDREQSSG